MAVARGRIVDRESAEAAGFLLPIVLFVLLFALLPVALLFGQGWLNGGGFSGFYSAVWGQVLSRDALTGSLEQGGLSAAVALALGYPVGLFVARYSFPGRSVLRTLLLLPFLLPTVVVVVGIVDIFGPQGLLSSAYAPFGWFGSGIPGIVAANLVFNVPIVILFTALGCESASRTLEETAATLGAPPTRVYRDVWAGPSLSGAAVGGLLTFVFSALAFAAPLMLCRAGDPRCYTLEAEVYALNFTYLDPTSAALLALGAMLLLAVPIGVYLLLVRRLRASSGPPPAPRPVRDGGWVAMALGSLAVLVFAAIALVLGAVLYRSLVPVGGGALGLSWSQLFSARTATALGIPVANVVGNTLAFAALAAGIALVLVLIASLALRSRPRWERGTSAFLFLPLLISPILLAFSLAEWWRPIFGGESTVWVLIVVAQATLALPFALQSLSLPLAGVSPAGSESVRTLGASRWTAFWDAELPRVRDGLLTAALFAFAIGLGEFTATYFLYVPSYTTLSVAVFQLQDLRASEASAGAAALLLLVSLSVFLALLALGRFRARPD